MRQGLFLYTLITSYRWPFPVSYQSLWLAWSWYCNSYSRRCNAAHLLLFFFFTTDWSDSFNISPLHYDRGSVTPCEGGRVPPSRAFVEDRIFLFALHFFTWKILFFFARSSLEYHFSSITSKWDREAHFTKTAFISFLILNILISRWRLKMIEELVFFYQIKKWPNTRKTKFFKKKDLCNLRKVKFQPHDEVADEIV